MNTLEQMLQRLKDDPIDYGIPLPLIDEAFKLVDDKRLTFSERRMAINKLEAQASGYELKCFPDVYETLYVVSDMDEICAWEKQQD